MIPANELRIGNYVYFDLHLKQLIDFELLEYATRHGKLIPITPEELEQCGFEWNYDLNVYVNKGIALDDEFYFVEIDFEGLKERIIEIKSLHELQNLYFALTGQELEVNINQSNVIHS